MQPGGEVPATPSEVKSKSKGLHPRRASDGSLTVFSANLERRMQNGNSSRWDLDNWGACSQAAELLSTFRVAWITRGTQRTLKNYRFQTSQYSGCEACAVSSMWRHDCVFAFQSRLESVERPFYMW